jgi:hypothetical protein
MNSHSPHSCLPPSIILHTILLLIAHPGPAVRSFEFALLFTMAKLIIILMTVCALFITSDAVFVSRKLQQVSGNKHCSTDGTPSWLASCLRRPRCTWPYSILLSPTLCITMSVGWSVQLRWRAKARRVGSKQQVLRAVLVPGECRPPRL